ncbi:MAG: hypothetical protein IH991_16650, partial [Planctomycetes bacterium]|nr:hypothetical protein [Planctomycetota bacterium]
MIYRLVGFYEYVNALREFDQLVQTASPQELEAMDEIVKDYNEYAVFANLSRRIQTDSSSLAEKGAADDDNFQRRGLGWVMALARVEVGAMLAGFTDVPQPFAVVRPTQFEMPAYRELLEDGLRTHYWSLIRDPAVQLVIAQSLKEPNHQTLAYVRRLSITRKFLHAVSQAG